MFLSLNVCFSEYMCDFSVTCCIICSFITVLMDYEFNGYVLSHNCRREGVILNLNMCFSEYMCDFSVTCCIICSFMTVLMVYTSEIARMECLIYLNTAKMP